MFFLRMITRSFTRQLRRRLLIALTVCLSATVSVSMLGVVFDVGDKLNAELSTYGSNITVQPKADAVVSDLYNTESGGAASTSDPTAFLKESDAAKIKTIFWSFNITNFAPQLNIHAMVNGTNVPVVGTWFNKDLKISTGETTVVGVEGMRSWWQLDGKWPKDDSDQGVIGKTLASELGVTTGDTITLNKTTASGKKNEQKIKLTGVYDSGDEDNGSLYIASSTAQVFADLPDSVDKIEVKALTTPENDLARKAAANPAALSQEEWETWYCTAYPSSIAYQIEEVIPGAVAKQVRQVAALQGNVLQKTQAVMILMTVLSLIAAAVAVANLMVASIGERSGELALLKALWHDARYPSDAGRNGGNLAAGRDCGRAARFRRGPADRPGGIRFRHHDAADGVRAGVRAAGCHRAAGVRLLDSFDSESQACGGAPWSLSLST